MRAFSRLVIPATILASAYALVVRPRILRWGATDEEASRPYPGADVIPDGARSATMAVTINAPPARVWPWLVQMGYGRAGWYSWDHLDNWGHSSADRLHPEWQDIKLGDRLPSMPNNKAWWEVAALERERFLGLRASLDLRGRPFDPRGPRPRFFTDSLWGFQLEEQPGERTRLIVSGCWAMQPRWLRPVLSVLVLEPPHWIMQTRQFSKLKRLVEQDTAVAEREAAPPPREPAAAPSPAAIGEAVAGDEGAVSRVSGTPAPATPTRSRRARRSPRRATHVSEVG